MAYFVSKLLQPALYPTTWLLVLMLAGVWLARRQRRRLAIGVLMAAILTISLCGAPIVSDRLVAGLERHYPSQPIGDFPVADAIVVLGGTTNGPVFPRHRAEEARGSRLLHACRLFKAGRAPVIIVTGGSPYSLPDGSVRTEADDMRDVLIDMGVPTSNIILERESRNTDENARFTARILRDRGARQVILVTSAYHMRRAVALFAAGEVGILPAPCGHLVDQSPFRPFHLVPNPDALANTSRAIKEHVGYLTYRLAGRF